MEVTEITGNGSYRTVSFLPLCPLRPHSQHATSRASMDCASDCYVSVNLLKKTRGPLVHLDFNVIPQ